MTQELYELPEGWEWKKFKDVCLLKRGYDLPTRLRVEGKHPLYSANGVTDYIDQYKIKGPGVITGRSGTIGKVHYVDNDYWPLNTALYVQNFCGNHPRFIKYFLQNFDLTRFASGAAVPTLNRNSLSDELVCLPKQFEEQQRIVEKLEALLSRIDTTIEHLEHSLELNDQLFASSLNQAFNPLGAEVQSDGTYQLPEGWEWKTLNEIFEIARGGSPRPIKSFITDNEDGINWIKIGDVATGAKYISQTAEKIKPEGVSKSRMVYPGDFILSNSMSFGRPYIMQIEGCIHDGWLLLRPLDKTVSVDFMYQLLSSPFMYRQFSFAASGTTVKNLNSDIARKSKVPIPNLEKQAAITAKLDLVQSKTQANKQVLQQKIEQLQQLKASLLDSAFRGEL